MYLNPDHKIKVVAMPIYDKNPTKVFFYGTCEPIFQGNLAGSGSRVRCDNLFINHDPVLTLSYFTTRSKLASYVFVEWGKLFNTMSFEGEKLAGY